MSPAYGSSVNRDDRRTQPEQRPRSAQGGRRDRQGDRAGARRQAPLTCAHHSSSARRSPCLPAGASPVSRARWRRHREARSLRPTPPLPHNPPHLLAAPSRGKGGPQAHPAGTRSALPAAGAVGEAPVGVGAGAVVGAVSEATAAAAPVRTQSADGPQDGQSRPTTAESNHRQNCCSTGVFSHSPLRQTTPRSILQGGG